MSEISQSPGSMDGKAPSAEAAGAMLRKAREAAGLHVAALAVALKVPVNKLEALEAGRIDLLPDATFARGLAASICRGLKVDPKPVLDLMPGIGNSRLGAAPPAINERFEPAGSSSGAAWRQRPSPVMFAVLLLLLGAIVIYFYPLASVETETPTDAGNATPGTVQMTVPSEVAAPVAPASMALPEPQAVLAPPVGGAATPPAPPVAATSAPAEAAADALMVFTAKGESWVQVTDAKGVVVLRRTMQANERATATGALPLAVVVGRIDVVDVQVRGQPMDLRSIAKTNVARFEVK
jgi:cytoskeleton protein RodZ